MTRRPVRVLLVEDNPGDVELTRESLSADPRSLQLLVVEDGVEAVEFVHRRGRHADAPRPDLVLLDLNLPRLNGQQVLAEIKDDPTLRQIPVVVLTSSEAEADVAGSYARGANCFVTKPLDLKAFESLIHTLEGFWFRVVKLPRSRENHR